MISICSSTLAVDVLDVLSRECLPQVQIGGFSCFFTPLTHARKTYTYYIPLWAFIFEDTLFINFFHECLLFWTKVLSILIKTTVQFTILSANKNWQNSCQFQTSILPLCWWEKGEGHFIIPWLGWSTSGVKKFGDDLGKGVDELLREMATQYWEKGKHEKGIQNIQNQGQRKTESPSKLCYYALQG